MKDYLILIGCALLLYILYSKALSFITSLRIKKGLQKKIKIIITNDKTLVLDNQDQEILNEPNEILYIKERNNKVLMIGNSADKSKIKKEYEKHSIHKLNIINEFEDVKKHFNDFWYQYITYYTLKSKRRIGLSAFIIASISIKIEVSSELVKDRLIDEFKNVMITKKPRLYNIFDVN